MRKVLFSALASFVAFATVSPAMAVPVLFCKDGPGINLVTTGCISGTGNGYTGGGDGIYSNSGGGDPEARVEQAIFGATGAVVNLTLYGKSDSNPALFAFDGDNNPANDQTGTFDLLDNSILIKYITIKAANSFALYEFAGAGVNSGSFTTAGILNNGRQQPQVSHISFWTTGSIPAVPESGTWAMLVAGFGVVGGASRLRRTRRSVGTA